MAFGLVAPKSAGENSDCRNWPYDFAVLPAIVEGRWNPPAATEEATITRPALAAERALGVINLLTVHPTERFSLTEIARRTGINSASAHALLQAMVRTGYLQRDPTYKSYALGPAVVAAGTAALEQLPVIRAAQHEIDLLGRELGLETSITTVVHEEVIVVGGGPHVSPYGPMLVIGQRVPLLPPIGLVFMAFATPTETDLYLQRAQPPLSPGEVRRLRNVLAKVQKAGYFIAIESETRQAMGEVFAESIEGSGSNETEFYGLLADLPSSYYATTIEESESYDVAMITAPIFDPNQKVAAAITLQGFAPGQPAMDLIAIAERLRGVAHVITKRSHGRLPS